MRVEQLPPDVGYVPFVNRKMCTSEKVTQSSAEAIRRFPRLAKCQMVARFVVDGKLLCTRHAGVAVLTEIVQKRGGEL